MHEALARIVAKELVPFRSSDGEVAICIKQGYDARYAYIILVETTLYVYLQPICFSSEEIVPNIGIKAALRAMEVEQPAGKRSILEMQKRSLSGRNPIFNVTTVLRWNDTITKYHAWTEYSSNIVHIKSKCYIVKCIIIHI